MSRTLPVFAVVATWLAALLLAYRSIWAVLPDSKVVGPIEAFFFDTDTTIPALHFALFALVLVIRRRAIRTAMSNPAAPVVGTLVSVGGVALLGWAKLTRQIDLEIDSLVLLIAGSALLLGGRRLLEWLVLPLSLLWLARPLPPMLTHHLHEALQRATGTFAQTVLSPFAEVGRSGHLLRFQERTFQVVEGCSGLRLEITLLTAALVYLAFVSKSRRQTLGVLALALLLGPLMNGLRVISIMLNPHSEVAQIHSTQGLLFVSLSIIVIALVDRALEPRLWPARDSTDEVVASSDLPRARRLWVGGLAFACLITSFLPYPAPPTTTSEVWALHEIRPQLGPWKRTRAIDLDRPFWGTVKFSNRLDWEFERENQSGLARVFVVTDRRRRRDQSSFSPKTRSRGAAWDVLETVPVRLDTPPYTAERSIQASQGERWLTLHYRIGERGLFEASIRWMLALDFWPGLVREDPVTVRIEVRIDERNPAAALAQLAEIQSEVGQALIRAAPGALQSGR